MKHLFDAIFPHYDDCITTDDVPTYEEMKNQWDLFMVRNPLQAVGSGPEGTFVTINNEDLWLHPQALPFPKLTNAIIQPPESAFVNPSAPRPYVDPSLTIPPGTTPASNANGVVPTQTTGEPAPVIHHPGPSSQELREKREYGHTVGGNMPTFLDPRVFG